MKRCSRDFISRTLTGGQQHRKFRDIRGGQPYRRVWCTQSAYVGVIIGDEPQSTGRPQSASEIQEEEGLYELRTYLTLGTVSTEYFRAL